MEQLVLIVPQLSKRVDIVKKKQEIVSYVGCRLVKDNNNDIPGVLLKEGLSEEDKKTLNGLLSIEGLVMFINIPENYDGNDNFITCNLEEPNV